MNVSYSISNGVMNIFVDGKSYVVSKEHPKYDEIWDALRKENFSEFDTLFDLGLAITVWGKEKIVVRYGEVFYEGIKVNDNALVSRILEMIKQKEDYVPMAKFIDNLMQNPDKDVIPQVYNFLRNNMLPITKDGYFLAYKRVNANYTDCRTGKIDNSVGITVKEDRDLVDKNPNKTCSRGLHVCSFEYLKHFDGAKLLLCKVNPKDVVAVPVDYNDSKLRCCEYYVYADITGVDDPREVYEQKIVWDAVPEQEELEEDEVEEEVCDCGISLYECEHCDDEEDEEDYDDYDDEEDEEDYGDEEEEYKDEEDYDDYDVKISRISWVDHSELFADDEEDEVPSNVDQYVRKDVLPTGQKVYRDSKGRFAKKS